MKAKHPHQPLIRVDGVHRFKPNAIVKYLLDLCTKNKVADLNTLQLLPFSDEDRVQLAELIGYSLSGFAELPYVSDKVWKDVDK